MDLVYLFWGKVLGFAVVFALFFVTLFLPILSAVLCSADKLGYGTDFDLNRGWSSAKRWASAWSKDRGVNPKEYSVLDTAAEVLMQTYFLWRQNRLRMSIATIWNVIMWTLMVACPITAVVHLMEEDTEIRGIWQFGVKKISQSLDDVRMYRIEESRKRDLETRVYTKSGVVRAFTLLDHTVPKHFYVTLQEVGTNSVWNRVYVSKHCNNYGSLKKGETFNLKVNEYYIKKDPSTTYYEFTNLYQAFCY